MRIYIVDDSPVVRHRLVGLLSDHPNLEVVGEWDGADGVGTIERLRPDAVVVDLHLQKGNGFDLVRTLKRSPEPPLIIVLTNYPYPQYERRAREAGADYFFDKTNEFGSVLTIL